MSNIQFARELTKIYGIGIKKSIVLCKLIGVSDKTKLDKIPEYKKDLLNQKLSELRKSKIGLDNDLKAYLSSIFEKRIDLKTNKGLRAQNKLPLNGQRTRSNANTIKKMSLLY